MLEGPVGPSLGGALCPKGKERERSGTHQWEPGELRMAMRADPVVRRVSVPEEVGHMGQGVVPVEPDFVEPGLWVRMRPGVRVRMKPGVRDPVEPEVRAPEGKVEARRELPSAWTTQEEDGL